MKEKRKFLVDLHMHSTFSDGKLSIPELVDLFGARGFGAIAITDHLCDNRTVLGKTAHVLNRTLTAATFPLYQQILKSEAQRAWEQYRMVLIPGIEITKNSVANSRSAHVLALGVDQWISADLDVFTMVDRIHDLGGLAIAAHPVPTNKLELQTHFLWDQREALAGKIDAWEVASGDKLFREVVRSNLPKIANSDLHHPRQIESWKTLVSCERHAQTVLQAIKDQQVEFCFYKEHAWLHSFSVAPALACG